MWRGILLENGHSILAGDIREIAKEDGDLLLLENGSKIRPDDSDHLGEIHEIQITDNEGNNYNQLPIMGVSTTNGTGAEILAVSNDIGRITGVTRTNLGSGYDSVPDVIVQENLILEDIVGTFIAVNLLHLNHIIYSKKMKAIFY